MTALNPATLGPAAADAAALKPAQVLALPEPTRSATVAAHPAFPQVPDPASGDTGSTLGASVGGIGVSLPNPVGAASSFLTDHLVEAVVVLVLGLAGGTLLVWSLIALVRNTNTGQAAATVAAVAL